MTSIASFISKAKAIRLASVFNPYSDICSLHDRPDAPAIRTRNLESFLRYCLVTKGDTVWFGRDFGYRGGRRTGIALTDEVRLEPLGIRINASTIQRATVGDAISERTATEAWKIISRISVVPFLWNIFPMHPHEPGNPMSNRNHTKAEFAATWDLNMELLNLLNPAKVIAIGGDAQRMLEKMGIEAQYVRHPSYGGQVDFLNAMARIYAIPVEEFRVAKVKHNSRDVQCTFAFGD